MRPNIVVIVLDAARRDSLEPYGAPPGSTPAIAQLAMRGRALPDVYATSCWTVPSHTSIFTGLFPRRAGLARAKSPNVTRPVLEMHRERLLANVLREAGYTTGAVSANLWISPGSGFDTGFEDFEQIDSGRHARIHAPERRERIRWLWEAARGRVDDGARAIAATLDRWRDGSRDDPFFWFVNVVECHSPYLPPRPYGDVSLIDRLRAAEDARRYYTFEGIWRACAGISEVPDETLERVRRMYRASIRYMDDWLGRVLEQLDSAGVLDDTLVIVTADHGENLGEGRLLAHAFSLDNRLIRVPLIFAGPGAPVEDVSSLVELPRMIAEAAELDEHPWTDGAPRGFGVAQLDPPFDSASPDAIETLERAGLESAIEMFTTPLSCAVAGGLKLVRRAQREELYDLAADPLELRPLSPDDAVADGRAEEVDALRGALRHPAVDAAGPAVPAASTDSAPSDDEVRQLEERMKLLGYM